MVGWSLLPWHALVNPWCGAQICGQRSHASSTLSLHCFALQAMRSWCDADLQLAFLLASHTASAASALQWTST